MSSPAFEAFLALLYTDAKARERFLDAPLLESRRAGLSPSECEALARIDREGLVLAATSFEHKRAASRRSEAGRRG